MGQYIARRLVAQNISEDVSFDNRDCGEPEEGVDFWGDDLASVGGVRSAEECAAACGANLECLSYTFVRILRRCYLKNAERPHPVKRIGGVSGLPPCTHGRTPAPPPPPRPAIYSNHSLRGVAYGPLPCKEGCYVSEDMLQEGYQSLWGPDGRDDLGVIRQLGANTVRLYHSIGLEGRGSHDLFLDRAQDLGLDVMPGYHTYNAIYGACPEFDCYEGWKKYTLEAFEQGFRVGDSWHPSVSTLLLFNELDFFRAHGPTAHLRSALSAMDGVLAAEKEAGVKPGRVRLSIAWSNAPGESLDKKVSGFAVWAFQDIVAGVADPSIVDYVPRTSQAGLAEAYRTRWAHGINVQTPGIVGYMAEHYKRFEPTPWFIGEYGANGMPRRAIKAELQSMDAIARDPTDPFMGLAVFQFQAAYFKGGSEMNFGLFRLGSRVIGETGDICDKGVGCNKWPVYCLTTASGGLPSFVRGRAEAVADVWGGTIDQTKLC